jgi:hypothetical protein
VKLLLQPGVVQNSSAGTEDDVSLQQREEVSLTSEGLLAELESREQVHGTLKDWFSTMLMAVNNDQRFGKYNPHLHIFLFGLGAASPSRNLERLCIGAALGCRQRTTLQRHRRGCI